MNEFILRRRLGIRERTTNGLFNAKISASYQGRFTVEAVRW